MSKHLVLLTGSGGTSLDLVLASLAKVTGRLSIIHVTEHGRVPSKALRGRWETGFKGHWFEVPEASGVLPTAQELNSISKFDGVVTYTEILLIEQARIARHFGLPGNSMDAVRRAQSKLAQREALRSAGLACPAFHPIFNMNDLERAACVVGFPGVLKPAHGVSSFLVKPIAHSDDLFLSASEAFARIDGSPLRGEYQALVYEGHLEGPERVHSGVALGDYVSVESVIQDGRAFHVATMDKLPILTPFIEEGDIVPSSLQEPQLKAIEAYADAVIAAMELTTGATHMEIKLTSEGPVLIEVNARVGGASAVILQNATDYDIVEEAAKAALDTPIRREVRFANAVCFRSLPFPRGPVLLEHQSEAESISAKEHGLRFLRQRFPSGTVLDQRNPGLQSAGVVSTFLVTGSDLAECLARSATVEKALDLRWNSVEAVVPANERVHVLLIDRVGYTKYRDIDGRPFLDPAQFDITLLCRPEIMDQVRLGEVERVFPVDLRDEVQVEAIAARLHSIKPVERICAFSEAHILLAARLRDRFALTEGGEIAALHWRDKLVMKRALSGAGLRVPAFAPAERDAVRSLVSKHGKVVVKPVLGSGSKGLHFVTSGGEAEDLIERLGAELRHYEVEEHIDGELFHIDGVVQDGEILWAEVTRYGNVPYCFLWNEPNFAHRETRPAARERLLRFNDDALRALDLRDGVFQHECFIATSGEVVHCEMAARAGGNGIVPYLEHLRGVNLYEAMFDVQTGRRAQTAKAPRSELVGYVGVPLGSGTIVSMPSPADIALPGVARYIPLVREGDVCASSEYSGQASALFVIDGDSIEEIEQLQRRIKKLAAENIIYERQSNDGKETTR
jgi:biotin carboxylase